MKSRRRKLLNLHELLSKHKISPDEHVIKSLKRETRQYLMQIAYYLPLNDIKHTLELLDKLKLFLSSIKLTSKSSSRIKRIIKLSHQDVKLWENRIKNKQALIQTNLKKEEEQPFNKPLKKVKNILLIGKTSKSSLFKTPKKVTKKRKRCSSMKRESNFLKKCKQDFKERQKKNAKKKTNLTTPIKSSGVKFSNPTRNPIQIKFLRCPFYSLGLSKGSSFKDCKKKYHEQILKVHPDKVNGKESEFQDLQLTWTRLKNIFSRG